MKERNKNNSIIFLTTLSVYLGLVLVGGAMPTVLAQAATTRNFNVQDEIEAKDDLDNNPDDDIDFDESLNCYIHQVHSLFSDLKNLKSTRKFDLDSDEFQLNSQIFLDFDTPLINPLISSKSRNTRGLFFALNNINLNIGGCGGWSKWLSDNSSKSSATDSKLKLSYNRTGLSLEISTPKATERKASFFAEKFNQSYQTYRFDAVEVDKTAIEAIYENTKISSKNNQVIIVTRLPRGSLDALFKQDAKAENQ